MIATLLAVLNMINVSNYRIDVIGLMCVVQQSQFIRRSVSRIICRIRQPRASRQRKVYSKANASDCLLGIQIEPEISLQSSCVINRQVYIAQSVKAKLKKEGKVELGGELRKMTVASIEILDADVEVSQDVNTLDQVEMISLIPWLCLPSRALITRPTSTGWDEGWFERAKVRIST